MANEKDFQTLEAWFDGEAELTEAFRARIDADPELREAYEELQEIRAAIREADAPVIQDAQFRVFMDGIREEIAPAHGGGLWQRWTALASMAAASFLIALSVFYIGWGDPAPIHATEVESVASDIEGATWDLSGGEGGTTTIWVNLAEDDL